MEAINAQFDVILSALPGIGAKAAVVAERRPTMTLWVLALSCCSCVPGRGHPAPGRARRGQRDRREHRSHPDAARAGSEDLDAAPLLLTTQTQVKQTVANVAAYGGSLDVILDDA